MIILSLDPSTSFGFCLCRKEETPSIIDYGTWALRTETERKKAMHLRPGQYFARALRALTDLRKQHGIEDEPIQIVIEDTSLSAAGTRETKHIAESWVGQFETYAEVRGWPAPRAVGVNSWRSAFIGRSMAPKEITGSEARRKWIKEATIRECQRRGLDPKDDNASDAIGILFWFLVGGPVVQEQRRADRKAKTAAKRAQKTLFKRAA